MASKLLPVIKPIVVPLVFNGQRFPPMELLLLIASLLPIPEIIILEMEEMEVTTITTIGHCHSPRICLALPMITAIALSESDITFPLEISVPMETDPILDSLIGTPMDKLLLSCKIPHTMLLEPT